jgi:hypothetical protein
MLRASPTPAPSPSSLPHPGATRRPLQGYLAHKEPLGPLQDPSRTLGIGLR